MEKPVVKDPVEKNFINEDRKSKLKYRLLTIKLNVYIFFAFLIGIISLYGFVYGLVQTYNYGVHFLEISIIIFSLFAGIISIISLLAISEGKKLFYGNQQSVNYGPGKNKGTMHL